MRAIQCMLSPVEHVPFPINLTVGMPFGPPAELYSGEASGNPGGVMKFSHCVTFPHSGSPASRGSLASRRTWRPSARDVPGAVAAASVVSTEPVFAMPTRSAAGSTSVVICAATPSPRPRASITRLPRSVPGREKSKIEVGGFVGAAGTRGDVERRGNDVPVSGEYAAYAAHAAAAGDELPTPVSAAEPTSTFARPATNAPAPQASFAAATCALEVSVTSDAPGNNALHDDAFDAADHPGVDVIVGARHCAGVPGASAQPVGQTGTPLVDATTASAVSVRLKNTGVVGARPKPSVTVTATAHDEPAGAVMGELTMSAPVEGFSEKKVGRGDAVAYVRV